MHMRDASKEITHAATDFVPPVAVSDFDTVFGGLEQATMLQSMPCYHIRQHRINPIIYCESLITNLKCCVLWAKLVAEPTTRSTTSTLDCHIQRSIEDKIVCAAHTATPKVVIEPSTLFSRLTCYTPVTPEARCHCGFWSKPPSPQ